jgi:hypothetical protein
MTMQDNANSLLPDPQPSSFVAEEEEIALAMGQREAETVFQNTNQPADCGLSYIQLPGSYGETACRPAASKARKPFTKEDGVSPVAAKVSSGSPKVFVVCHQKHRA